MERLILFYRLVVIFQDFRNWKLMEGETYELWVQLGVSYRNFNYKLRSIVKFGIVAI